MNQVEQVLELDQIKKMWMDLTLTEGARCKIAETQPYLEEGELLSRLRETTQARVLIEKGGNPPLVSLNGIKDLILAAQKGSCLSGFELEEIEKALVAIKRLKEYLNRCKQFQVSLAYDEEGLDSQEELREWILLQIRNGAVRDDASKLLRSVRGDIERAENKMREKADSMMRSHKEWMSDSFSTFKNGHVCIPVKKEYKLKVGGSIIDKSSTGNTLFIEPTAAAKYYEELQNLKIEEENEERRILYTLTAMVADAAPVIEHNMVVVEKLDFIFSKGKLSIAYDGIEPKINMERRIQIKDGRHPLMDPKICVPLQFQIGEAIKGIVITGPNTGGKTVAIKTVALNSIMAQCGLHVACREADICMNSNYLCDIGDGQNLSENLSTFSAHIQNVLEILKQVNQDSLVIMDELGSGTDPTEGMGIAIAILEELKRSGALFLVTTHYPEVKQYAQQEEQIVNARMTFDKESLQPLYQMIIGEAGESCAFAIAKRLGMPSSMLQIAARAAYGEESFSQQKQDIRGEVQSQLSVEEKYFNSKQQKTSVLQRRREIGPKQQKAARFRLGDSVMVYPDKKIGIICRTTDDKGVLQVQLPDKKIWVNHKRIKLHVAAEELYPENYDFSILFDSVANRKLRHQMEKRHVEGQEIIVDSM